MLKFLTDCFTERDGTSWCMGRSIGFLAFAEMMYKFFQSSSVDFQGFAIGVSSIIAAVAAKNFSERGQ